MAKQTAPQTRMNDFQPFEPFEAADFSPLLQSAAPFATLFGQLSSQWVQLIGNRAGAYADLPNRVAACQTPGDLMTEQFRFLSEMQAHYTQAALQATPWGNADRQFDTTEAVDAAKEAAGKLTDAATDAAKETTERVTDASRRAA